MKNKKLTFHFLNDVIIDVRYIGLDNTPLVYFDCDKSLLTKTFGSVNDFQGQSLIEIIKCENYENTALNSDKIPYNIYSTPKIHLMEIGQSNTGISINANLLAHSYQLITFLKSHLILRETVLSEDVDSSFSSPSINEKLILENPTFNCSFRFKCVKIIGDCYLINNASLTLYSYDFINSTLYVNSTQNCSFYYGTEMADENKPNEIYLMNEGGGFYFGAIEGVQNFGEIKIESGKKGYKIEKNLTSSGAYYYYLVKINHNDLYLLFGIISSVLVLSAIVVVISLYTYKKKLTLKRMEAQNTVLFGDVLNAAI
ncbi:hypothetical protein TVAG_257290 [Trichomonas vaginalis G3]|uniref:Uncharacterized protein n=1 Tax=Trichomonas vaginalis (strain ATCC PRA-98 / G3) TaxID=412133 RepID=A2ELG3_TRIV3|nr:hypothetical protein TVAGG3_0005440 [Trichomonas vaginalis G3]EAY06490.1 hypothetical protein TVAG_257290 [Trichomonas vaginalis G3]KAI5538878.1 hypothetical protein TVAGG3_0005440 [Trichomonas vaginalis G3]|eukprot:XP_001318713.1 hypothetical protein [Trichomonas vaginalis G3]